MVVNQKFIAEKAGVSQKTVSLYFKARNLIGSKSREKIEAVVKRHNYFPNAAARSIKSNRFNRIACVVVQYGDQDSVQHPHLMAYINGASRELAKSGYSLVVESVFIDLFGSKVDFPEFFSVRSADGVIGLAGSWIPPEVDHKIAELELPAVWLNRKSDDPAINCLLFDEAAGAEELARHFLSKGVRRIAWYGPDFEEDTVVHYSSRARFETIRAVMEREGGCCVPFFIHTGEKLDGKAREVLARLSGFDGVICYSYTFRLAIFMEAIAAGIKLSDKRIGHFGSVWEFHPRDYAFLDYVAMPETEMGRRGAKYILNQLNNETDAGGLLLAPLMGKFHAGS